MAKNILINQKVQCDELNFLKQGLTTNDATNADCLGILPGFNFGFLFFSHKYVLCVCCFAGSLNVLSTRNAEKMVVTAQVFFKVKVVCCFLFSKTHERRYDYFIMLP